MQALRFLLLGAALAISYTSAAKEPGGLEISHFDELQELRYSTAAGARKAKGGGPAGLTFNALGRTFDLQLDSNERVLSKKARDALSDGIRLYRGQIAGNPDSWVRLVMFNGNPSGLIWDGSELLAVEVPGDSAVATTGPVIYRLADAYATSGVMSCGTAAASVDGMYKTMLGELDGAVSQAAGAVSEINIGAVGDFEFTSSIGGDAAAAIATRLNSVDGIFSAQVGVQITLRENEVFTTADDPFTSTTDASTLLAEVGQYRRNSPNQISQGLTHLFTGRDLAGSRVGLANIGVLCNNRFSVGLTQGTLGAAMDSLVAAHEIGHNFGAPHDAETGSACASVPADFIMAPTLRSSITEFSSCSIEQMQPVIAGALCITSLLGVDMTASADATSSPVLLGDNVAVDITVTNSGSDEATNVALDVTLPNIVTYVSATTSAGTCSEGAGQVSCQLGSMPGGGMNIVTISTTSSAVGTGSFDVSVSADADEDPDNNQVSVLVTVDPAVDLVVNAAGGAQLDLDESTTVTVSLDNTASLDASNATVSVTLDAGLRANAASWSIGSCSINGQQIDCQADRFAAQSSTTLMIDLTGTAAGQHSYAVTIASAEADRNQADNSGDGIIGVDAVVDLVVNGTGGGQLIVNESTRVTASLENTATFDATSATLTVTLDAGLRADAASWPIGSCSISGQRIDCQAARFAAQSTTTLNVDVTGTATGQHSYRVALTAAEADPDPANNNGTGTVTVSESGGGGGTGGGGSTDSGGGGATGSAFLGLLLLALMRRRLDARPHLTT